MYLQYKYNREIGETNNSLTYYENEMPRRRRRGTEEEETEKEESYSEAWAAAYNYNKSM